MSSEAQRIRPEGLERPRPRRRSLFDPFRALMRRERRFAHYLWLYKVTMPGKLMIAGTTFAGMVGVSTLDIPAYHLVTLLAALLGVAWCAGLLLRPRLSVSGRFPDKATAGQPVTGTLTVSNRSRLPVFDVGMGFFNLPQGLRTLDGGRDLVPVLRRGASATVSVRLEPLRRGAYALPPLRAYSTFPFGLFRSGKTRITGGTLLVQPSFHPVESVDLPVSARYQPGGVALTSNVGESPEYIGNRDYRPGDPLRRIDFRSWARLARPAVREYQEEYYCRVALVLDTFVPGRRRPGPKGFPTLEAAIGLSASVADALTRGEYLIDIFAAGPELYVFRAGRHIAHLDNILEILACVDRCRSNPFESLAPALSGELGNISTVVCVLLDWDASREALVRAAREAGCATRVLLVRDGDTTEPFLAAEELYGEFSQHGPADLGRGGIERL